MSFRYHVTHLCCILLTFGTLALSSTRLDKKNESDVRNQTENAKPIMQGWTPSINQRGTFDIIYTCAFTLFLCSWSVLCVNVPDAREGTMFKLWRKFYLTILCLFGPEFIMQMALAQLMSARASVALFHELGHDQWTLTHGFYADMGGFVLHPRIGSGDEKWERFPVNAQQLHYLLKHGYVNAEMVKAVDKRRIKDKNKLDNLLRLLVFVQNSWFLINLVARRAEDLAITTLELTTAAFIACGYSTQIFWFYKPADIDVPEILETTAGIDQILREAGDAAHRPYARTPLDFVSRQEWSWSILWSAGRGYFRVMGLKFGVRGTPMSRFSNTTVPPLSGIVYIGAMSIAALYFSIFVIAWNWSFPTDIEKWLWRASCIISLICLVPVYLTSILSFGTYMRRRPSRPVSINDSASVVVVQRQNVVGRAWHRFVSTARNNSIMKEPELNAPMHAIVITWIVGIFYCFARSYVWIEDLMGLRSLPTSAYKTVNWGLAIPFLGAI